MAGLLDRITQALSGWLKRALPQRVNSCPGDNETRYECTNHQYWKEYCYFKAPNCVWTCDWTYIRTC